VYCEGETTDLPIYRSTGSPEVNVIYRKHLKKSLYIPLDVFDQVMINDKVCELWDIAEKLGAKSCTESRRAESALKRSGKISVMAHFFGAQLRNASGNNTGAGDDSSIKFAKPRQDTRLQVPFDRTDWVFAEDETTWLKVIQMRESAARLDNRIRELGGVATVNVECSYNADNKNATTAELLAGHFGSLKLSAKTSRSVSTKYSIKIEFWTREDYESPWV
jgi:hypothetical protein